MQDRTPRRRARGAFLAPLLLLLLLLSTSTETHAISPSLKEAPAQAFYELNMTQSAMALSGCEMCQRSGVCTQAFHNQVGMFCHTLASGRPCCCPPDAECVPDVYNCRCRARINNGYPPAPAPNQQPGGVRVVTTRTGPTHTEGGSSHWLLFVLSILGCCLCCGCCCRHNDEEVAEVVEVHRQEPPVYVATEYGTNQPGVYGAKPYIAPGMSQPAPPAQYAYGYASAPPYQHNGGNALAAGAVGGVAGLAGGMLIGSMLGGDHNRDESTTTTTTTEYFGDGGGPGYYGAQQQASAGYEFSGDTGGDNNWGDGGFAGDDGTFDGDC